MIVALLLVGLNGLLAGMFAAGGVHLQGGVAVDSIGLQRGAQVLAAFFLGVAVLVAVRRQRTSD